VSAAAGAVTLLSGFGLGTVLMPVFALLFPVEAANVISAMVDVARLATCAVGLGWLARTVETPVRLHGRAAWLVATACIAGCVGSLVGAHTLKRGSMRGIRTLVAAMLLLAAAAMIAGVI